MMHAGGCQCLRGMSLAVLLEYLLDVYFTRRRASLSSWLCICLNLIDVQMDTSSKARLSRVNIHLVFSERVQSSGLRRVPEER
jgi:hypothetical protein